MVTECPYVVAGITPGQGGREGRPQGEGAQMIGCHNLKECEMQSTETVLGILRERGRRGLPCNEAIHANPVTIAA
jgi:hypothetical protein